MSSKSRLLIAALVMGLFQTIAGQTVYAQEQFFKGKQVRIIVGLSTGGGYDRAARLIARHLGKYIPGNPDMVVQNMPGAGSVTATNYVWGVAKPDGLTLLAPHNNFYLSQLSGQKEVQFDLPKFQWIGSLENDDMMIFARADAPFKSMSEVVRQKITPKCGSTGVGSSDYVMSKILEETIDAQIQHVTGYPGSSEIAIALERGEVQCMGLTISTYYGREPFLTWLKSKFVRFLAQSGRKERCAGRRRADHLRAHGGIQNAGHQTPRCGSHAPRRRVGAPAYGLSRNASRPDCGSTCRL